MCAHEYFISSCSSHAWTRGWQKLGLWWVGLGAQIYGQTLFWMFLWGWFLDEIKIQIGGLWVKQTTLHHVGLVCVGISQSLKRQAVLVSRNTSNPSLRSWMSKSEHTDSRSSPDRRRVSACLTWDGVLLIKGRILPGRTREQSHLKSQEGALGEGERSAPSTPPADPGQFQTWGSRTEAWGWNGQDGGEMDS